MGFPPARKDRKRTRRRLLVTAITRLVLNMTGEKNGKHDSRPIISGKKSRSESRSRAAATYKARANTGPEHCFPPYHRAEAGSTVSE